MEDINFTIDRLGEPGKPSPLGHSTEANDFIANYTEEDARVVFNARPLSPETLAFEQAGPRKVNYFSGEDVTAGILTCGGLCPGLNDVIRGLVMTMWRRYSVRRIYGFRYGFQGLVPEAGEPPIELTPYIVSTIHQHGGTILGSSRGPQDVPDMVDNLEKMGINVIFVIGGDGGMRGANALYQEVKKRGARISVIGVPKTIDNDLPCIERSFGFNTAVASACEAVSAAWVEAQGAPRGVGLVRLMGRHAGFIAAAAALASRQVDLVLVPELPFDLRGEDGVLDWLRHRLETEKAAVIVVAEGAGQRHLAAEGGKDLSGNDTLGDIGTFLRDTIKAYFKEIGEEANLKYIDPSYIIWAAPAIPADAIFCGRLAENAVHAAMLGRTGMVVGLWMNRFTHVPLAAVNNGEKRISLDSPFWRSVIECTDQPALLSK